MSKKLMALLLTLTMVAALTACGGKEEEKEPAGETQDQVEETLPDTDTAEDGKGSEEEEETEGRENAPADSEEKPEAENTPAKPEEEPETKPVQKPENVPAEKPVEQEKPAAPPVAPPADTQNAVDLNAFYESVASSNAEWPAMMLAEGELLENFYPGLSAISTKQCSVYMPMMSSVVAEIALVEVGNEADVQAVKDIFQARINYQVGDENNPGGAWYPESIEGWKTGSRVVSSGNCVMMVAYAGADDIVAAFNALFA